VNQRLKNNWKMGPCHVFVCSRRVPIGSVGVLRLVLARMSENTAQGQESELQDARVFIISFSDADLH